MLKRRFRRGLLATLVVCLAASAARAEDRFLDSTSQLITREMRKAARDKPTQFTLGPLSGNVVAVDPDSSLHAEVKDFKLDNDLLSASAVAWGSFKVDCQIDGKRNLVLLLAARVSATAEARFVKEGDKFFVEPKIHDMQLNVTIERILSDDLQGGEELLSGLITTAFNKNKQKLIDEANQKIGRRPF